MQNSIFIGQKGQAFEPFKMLIGAIMALAVLVIIISAINYFEELRLNVSEQRFYDGLSNAARQPNGSPLIIEDVQFQRGDTFSSNSLGKSMGLASECVSFGQSNSPVFEASPTSVTIRETIVANVVVTCDVSDSDICEIECSLSFEEAT